MFDVPEFDREKLKDKFYDMLYKYDGYCTKKEIAALLACEAESAAHLYAWKCSTRYADYVRDQNSKLLGHWIPLEYDGYADGNPVWDKWKCSECGEEHYGVEDTLTAFCPDYGAKMQKGEDKE